MSLGDATELHRATDIRPSIRSVESLPFWLEPRIELARNYGLEQLEVNEALRLIRENEDVIRNAWNDHFAG